MGCQGDPGISWSNSSWALGPLRRHHLQIPPVSPPGSWQPLLLPQAPSIPPVDLGDVHPSPQQLRWPLGPGDAK